MTSQEVADQMEPEEHLQIIRYALNAQKSRYLSYTDKYRLISEAYEKCIKNGDLLIYRRDRYSGENKKTNLGVEETSAQRLIYILNKYLTLKRQGGKIIEYVLGEEKLNS